MSASPPQRPDASMTLITEMMQRPLDPSYAAAAEARQQAGLPPATGRRSPMLAIVAVLIGALLATSALALRAPTTSAGTVKSALVGRIETSRAHADAQTRLITSLRNEINSAQAAALSQQSQSGIAARLSGLEQAAGTVSVTGPGLVLTIDDAPATVGDEDPDVEPGGSAGFDQGKVIARDLQVVVNGLWEAGAEAISINGHRLTARASIRFAGEAILVNYRPLTRPYVINAIGDPDNLGVEFAGTAGGSYLQSLRSNAEIRADVKSENSVVVPGQPALSLQEAEPVQSAVTDKSPATAPLTTTSAATTSAATTPPATTPPATEASP